MDFLLLEQSIQELGWENQENCRVQHRPAILANLQSRETAHAYLRWLWFDDFPEVRILLVFFTKSLKLYLTTNFSDIEPKWECPENRQGGRLVAEMTKEHRNDCMSTNWLNTILGLIGEECAHENVARCVGVQFQSRKKMDKISMWVASGHSKIEIKNLGGFMLGEFRFSFLDSK